MAGLISPKPLSYLQHNLSYNPYQRAGVIGYSDTQSNAGGLHTPDQSLVPFPDGSPALALAAHEEQKIYSLVVDLLDPTAREGALLELSKKREQFDELALVLWHSFGKSPLAQLLCITHPFHYLQGLCQPFYKRLSRCILSFLPPT